MQNIHTRYFLGLDVGQSTDYTALAVLERPRVQPSDPPGLRRPVYAMRYLQRFPPGTHYPEIIQVIYELLQSESLSGSMLVVDETGVGEAVVDLFVDALQHRVNCQFCRVLITNGHEIQNSTGVFQVPKKELVSTLQVLLHTRRLQISRSLPDADVLVKELESFRMKVPLAGTDTMEAWREQTYDDLLFAAAIAAWMGQRALPPLISPPRERVVSRIRAV